MKTLLSTTALVVALSMPTVLAAQTATTGTTTTTTSQTGAGTTGFLAGREQMDLLASELIGHDVYAHRAPEAMDATAGQTATGTDTMATDGQASTTGTGVVADGSTGMGSHDMTMMGRADLDTMDNIGQISDVVLSREGEVRAIVIGVGGFLGMGEREVAVTMDQVTFAADADDQSEMYIVVNTGAQMLQDSPAYERMSMTDTPATTGTATETATGTTGGMATGTTGNMATDSGTAGRTAFTAPAIEREGYTPVEVTEVSSEMLVGQAVYGVNDDSVGTIDDLIVDDQGAISQVIIDFGGFLGIGSSQVSVGFDELTIVGDEARSDVRVYVDATREQIQAQPQYTGTN